MKIPKQIRIAGAEYPVNYVENLMFNDRKAMGTISYIKTEIELIKNEQSHNEECQTLLHEVIHGIIRKYNVDLTDEESLVDGIATGLYQVLEDNIDRLYDIDKEFTMGLT